MDLTRQPPRRPSNVSIAGIVNLARMTDKARAYNDETQGEFLYGEDSGLDKILLDFLGISADDFADAAGRYGDEELGQWVRKVSDRTDAEIQDFNRHHLGREPEDEAAKQRLKARIEKYAPGRTDIRTVFQSIELDDWGEFWQVDLTGRAPRSPYCRDVAGVYGLARMADKARADRAGLVGEYIYNCPIDQAITEFLGISAEDYQEAACGNPNDLELSEWVREQTAVTPGEIADFNYRISRKGPESDEEREAFRKGLDRSAPGRADVATWFDLLDLDDEKSFNTVDLTRHPPRSPFDTSAGGILHLGRLIDKGRAVLTGTLGDYYYGDDSGADRALLGFLGVAAEDFTAALKDCPADADVLAWLEEHGKKSASEIAAFNEAARRAGPQNERQQAWFRGYLAKLDPERTDIDTFYALMHLDDQVSFARRKAGV